MKLQEYYELLENHDWHYARSDDPRAYREGMYTLSKVMSESRRTPQHKELYEAYSSYIYSGPGFSKEQQPKPECPKDM